MQYNDNYWMTEALQLAKQANFNNEVPVGAIVVYSGKIIGRGFNSSIRNCDPSSHAEILALREAALNINNYRLIDTTLYVTLEPCVMCFGAMIQARIKRLVFGASDPKTGSLGGYINLLNYQWNHTIECQGGLLSNECSDVLRNFFKERR
jgi:tRNA(adenine34) deaminase